MGTTGITGTMRGGTIITLDIPDGLLLGGGLAFAVDLGPALDGPDVVRVLQEELLLLQPGDELASARLDGVVAGLRQCGER